MRRSSRTRGGLVAALLAALCGCRQVPPPPATSIDHLEPKVGSVAVEVPVTIKGDGFYARVVQPLGGGSSEVDDHFRAWLTRDGQADLELGGVERSDDHTLSALVPSGLSVGPYGVKVVGPLGAGALEEAYTAAVLSSSLTAHASAPSPVGVGQRFDVTLSVMNSGTGAATGLAASRDPKATPASALDLVVMPSPADLAPGTSHDFTWTFVAQKSKGAVRVEVAVAGTDAASGVQVSVADRVELEVRDAASLSATAALDPSTLVDGQSATVAVTVTNGGTADASGVRVVATPSDPALVVLTSTPSASGDLQAGASRTLTFAWQSRQPGSLTFSVDVAGTDSGSGGSVSAHAETGTLTILP